jgi:hypothetical protein
MVATLRGEAAFVFSLHDASQAMNPYRLFEHNEEHTDERCTVFDG